MFVPVINLLLISSFYRNLFGDMLEAIPVFDHSSSPKDIISSSYKLIQLNYYYIFMVKTGFK